MTGRTERLAEIRARVNAATEGPWKWESGDKVPKPTLRGHHNNAIIYPRRDIYELVNRPEDAEFIAHAREDVPWLLAELVRVQEAHEQTLAALRSFLPRPRYLSVGSIDNQVEVRVSRKAYERAAALAAAGTGEEALPCGHPFSAVVSADEGTAYCGECAAAGPDGSPAPEETT